MMRRLTTLLAPVALAAGAVLFAGSPAQAASCSGSGCDGQNPETTGCSNSSVSTPLTASAGYSDWNLELRRSSGCSSYWARVRNYHQVSYIRATISVDRRYDYNGYITFQSTEVDHGQAVAYTNMWGRRAGWSYRACITIHGDERSTCTVWIR